jgi:hypothetical protein
MSRCFYLAVRKAAMSHVANSYPSLLQGEFLLNASLALVSEDYRADLDQLHEHFPSLGIVISRMLSQISPLHVGGFFSILEDCTPWLMTFLMQDPTPEQLQRYCDDLHHFIEVECDVCPALRELKLTELAALCKAKLEIRRLHSLFVVVLESRLPPLHTQEAYWIAQAFNGPLIQHVVNAMFQAYVPMCRANMSFREFLDASRGYKRGRLYGGNVPWTYLGEFHNVDPGMNDDLRPTGDRILLEEFCKPTQNVPDGISCSVCMADIDKNNKDEEQPVITKCCHYFHQVCLDKWVNDSGMNGANACPSCRAEMCQARARVPVSELEGAAQDFEDGNVIESIEVEALQVEGNVDRENSFFSRLRSRFRFELVPTLHSSRS